MEHSRNINYYDDEYYDNDFDVSEEYGERDGNIDDILSRLDSSYENEDDEEEEENNETMCRYSCNSSNLTDLSKKFFDVSRPEMSQEEAIELYEKYQAGEITKDDYIMEIVYSLTNYCKSIIHLHKRKMGADYLDLMQASYMAICEHIDEYDPHILKPSLYFYSFIVGKQAEECSHNKGTMSQHYVKMASQLKKAARELGYDSFLDPGLSPMMLAVKSDLPLSTIVNTIKAKKQAVYSIDAFVNVSGNIATPEEAYLKKELKEKINQQVRGLSSIEQFVLKNHIADEDEISLRKLVNLFRDPKFRSRFSDCDLPDNVTQNYLRQVYCRAVNRFAGNKEIRQLAEIDETSYQSSYEQAPSDIILSFVEKEILLV